MQIRRVLLLFVLVLGLSAVVASIAPPPDEEEPAPEPTVKADARPPLLKPALDLRVRGAGAPRITRRVKTGSSFSLTVRVPKPGDVILEGLGLRQTADPLTPAEFELLAGPAGTHPVAFAPIDGNRRVVGRLVFAQDATAATPRRRDR